MNVGPLALLAVFLTGIAGVMITGIKPILVAAYVASIHLSETQAGLLVGIDMGAATFGNFLVSWRLYAWPRAAVAAAALLIIGIGNLLSIASTSIEWLVLARLVTGMGSGVAAGMMAAALTTLPSPDRKFGLYSVLTLLVAALATWLSGKLLQAYGVGAMFSALAALALPALLLCRWFPTLQRPSIAASAADAPARDRAAVALVLTGTMLYYSSAGAVWAFMGQIGLTRGLTAEQVSRILGMALVCGAIGALVPFALHRIGRGAGISVSTTLTLIALALVSRSTSVRAFGAGACLFMFAWIAYFPYLMGLCSVFDPLGRLGASSLGMQNVGFALGPIAAGVLVQHMGYSPLLLTGAVSYSVASIAVLLAVHRARRADARATAATVQPTTA